MEKQISPDQLKRLQVLYGQLAARTIGMDTSREARIRWAIERLHKRVSSFKDLTAGDAGFLIDSIQEELGVKVPPRKRLNREQARRAGLDGRRDGAEYANAPQMATEGDQARIASLLQLLEWDEEAFRKFLTSSRSPLARRSDKQIRTTADANKVYWALKRIAIAKGLWHPKERK
ncbi:MAG: hypothetical protein P4K83_02280 [Terracidiphilus sp.]|nr:hypothetical protein [Terracidiphilus sp.]